MFKGDRMKNALVIGSGNIRNYQNIINKLQGDEYDYVICCDGGARHLKKLKLEPDYIVGDLDSIYEGVYNLYKDDCIVEKYEEEKDETDGHLGIKKALELKCKKITFIGGSVGERLDHTLCNLNLGIYTITNNCDMKIVDESNIVYIVAEKLEIKNKKGSNCSIIPITLKLEGVKTEGLKYKLDRDTVYIGESKTISNVIVEDSAYISLEKGIAFVILSEDEK